MDVMDFTIIGKQIKQVRKERNWTQAELAGLAGIDDKYLSNIETGKDRCSLNALLSIANALNISMDFLLGKNLKANGNSNEDMATPALRELLIGDIRAMDAVQLQAVAGNIDILRRYGGAFR